MSHWPEWVCRWLLGHDVPDAGQRLLGHAVWCRRCGKQWGPR